MQAHVQHTPPGLGGIVFRGVCPNAAEITNQYLMFPAGLRCLNLWVAQTPGRSWPRTLKGIIAYTDLDAAGAGGITFRVAKALDPGVALHEYGHWIFRELLTGDERQRALAVCMAHRKEMPTPYSRGATPASATRGPALGEEGFADSVAVSFHRGGPPSGYGRACPAVRALFATIFARYLQGGS